MTDEQLQPPEPVDEAIRLAEQQLERRIQELRGSIAGGAAKAREHSGIDAPNDTPPAHDDYTASWETPTTLQEDLADDSWEEDAEFGTPTVIPHETYTYEQPQHPVAPEPTADWEDAVMRPVHGGQLVEPVEPTPQPQAERPQVAPPVTGFAAPERSLTPEEAEQWAHMRTSMRQLQQSTDDLRSELPLEVSRRMNNDVAPELSHRVSQQLTSSLTDQMERVVRDELAVSNATVRQVQQQLPVIADQIERGIQGELAEPKQQIAHLHNELPAMVERLENTVSQVGATQEMERITSTIGEQQRQLTETLELLQRHRDQIQQDHDSLKMAIGSSFREEFASTRRGVRELVDIELGATLGDLAQASRATLDRLNEVTGELDRDRVQRVEDLELLVDAMTNGWQGLYSAVTRLFDRVEDFDSRMAGVETQMTALGTLDSTVNQALHSVEERLASSLSTMQQRLGELQPAPVLVTVQHPNAQVTHNE